MQYIEFSKRFKVEEVWPAELIAKRPDLKGKTLYDVLYANGQVNKYPVSDIAKANDHAWKGYMNDESKQLGYYLQKGLFEEYASFGRGHGHDLAPFDAYHKARGLRWPVVTARRRCGASGRATTRMSRRAPTSSSMATRTSARWCSRCPTKIRPKCRTRTTTCGCVPAACWSTGTPAR